MTIVVFLFLLIGTEPLPTFMILNQYKSVDDCKKAVAQLELNEAELKRVSCTPVITSPIRES